MRTTANLRHTVILTTLMACSGSDLNEPTLGDIQVTVATIGNAADLDPDGYTVVVDGGAREALPINGMVTFSQVTTGQHGVELSGLAPNCIVSGPDPEPVTVTAGETAQASFQVGCAPPPLVTGDLQVTTTTTGSPGDLDQDGYRVSVDGGSERAIAISGLTTYSDLAPGTQSVSLGGLATNCAVSGQNPATATIAAGAVAHTDFQINCAPI